MSEAALNLDTNDTSQTKTLRTLIIPFKGGQAVLPNSLVVEVLPFAPPLGIENAPRWIIGSMLWKTLTLPLVSLEYLMTTAEIPEAASHGRIIVIKALGNHPKLRYLGLVGSEAPRIIDLERDDILQELTLESLPEGVMTQALLQGHNTFIPDMDVIEGDLNRIMYG